MTARSVFCSVFAVLLVCSTAHAQDTQINYDEAKVPKYTLPNPLVSHDGKPVRDARTWFQQRRPEILRLFETDVYGRSPGRPEHMTFKLSSIDRHALGGTAIRKQVTVYFSEKKDGPKMDLLIYLPAHARGPVPAFLGLNFKGNQSVSSDPGIRLGDIWVTDPERKTMVKRRAAADSRGSAASRWQVEKILAGGYGLVTAYYGDIEPDFDGGMRYGVRSLYYKPGEKPAPDAWGAIGAWAWGLSRAMDYIETDHDIDAKHVAVMGHSRLGKTALWAGAQDTRFAIVISNCSGEGGAALSRRKFGETVQSINTHFPHWFCGNFKKYNDREEDLPVDQNKLLALIPPRPLYVAVAEQDRWSDPLGQFLAAVAAGPVYRLVGKQGLGTDQMPPIENPIMHTIGFHIRAGKHDVTAYDWEQYIKFADMHFQRGH